MAVQVGSVVPVIAVATQVLIVTAVMISREWKASTPRRISPTSPVDAYRAIQMEGETDLSQANVDKSTKISQE
jgi:hypothetical protein